MIENALVQNEELTGGINHGEESNLPFFTRITDTPLFIDRAKILLRSLANRPPLPTQIMFPEQDPEALALVEKYITGIENIFKVLEKHGMNKSVESYAFRLVHFIKENDWVNIVVRLQFATSLYALFQTLNDNLSSSAKNKWGVLEYDIEKNEYSINGYSSYSSSIFEEIN